MSSTIDERVVEMRFDNNDFEKNVQTSMDTLEKLDKSLDMTSAAKSFDTLDKSAGKVSFDGLISGVEAVSVKFSALEVVAITALQNIANKAVDAAESLVKSLTIDQVYSGFEEYELKMGSVQTIMNGTGESLETVMAYLEELNVYADKTIYSFSDMTSNIGKFTNAGVGLEDAVNAIKGVSNVAAVSGANANEASRAMYNFAQALSAGYVKLIDWKSIENANMATVEFKQQLIDTAVALGTVVETEGKYQSVTTDANGSVSDLFDTTSNFNDSLSAQWMTTEVLVQTLGDYADETTEIGKKAYAAAQDVKTFTQLMDTLKEAAGSGWATTWELIIGDYDEAKALFTEMSDVFGDAISKSAEARNSLLEGALGATEITSSWANIWLTESGTTFDAFIEVLKDTAKAHDIAIDDMIEAEGTFTATLKNGWLTSDIFDEALESLDNLAVGTSTVSTSLEELEEIANQVILGTYGNGEDRVNALTEAGWDYALVQSYVNHLLLDSEFDLEQLSDAQLKSAGYTEEQIEALREFAKQAEAAGTPLSEFMEELSKPTGRELLIESFWNVVNAISTGVSTIKGGWDDIFPAVTSTQLYNIITAVEHFTECLIMSEETADKVKRTFKGVFSILDIGAQGISTLAKGFGDLIGFLLPAGDGLLSISGSLGDYLVAIDEAVKSSDLFGKGLEALEGLLAPVGEIVKGYATNFTSAAVSAIEWAEENDILAKGIETLGAGLKTGAKLAKNWLDELKETPQVQSALAKLDNVFGGTVSSLKSYFSGGATAMKKFIGRLAEMDSFDLGAIAKDFKENVLSKFLDFGDVSANIKTAFEKIKMAVKNFSFEDAKSGIVDFVKSAGDKLEELKDKFSQTGIGSAILEFVGNVKEKLADLKENFTFENIKEAVQSFVTFITGKFEELKDSISESGFVSKASEFIDGILSKLGGFGEFLSNVKDTITNAVSTIKDVLGDNIGSITVIASVLALIITIRKTFSGITSISESLSSIADFLDAGKLKLQSESIKNVGLALLMFAAAVVVLVYAIKELDAMEFQHLLIDVGVLAAIMAALVVASVALNKFGSGSLSMASVLAMAVGIKILIGLIDDIEKIDVSGVLQNIGSFITVFAMLAALMVASRLAGTSSGTSILATAASLLIVVQAMKQIAKMDTEDIAKAMDTIAGITAMLTTLMRMNTLFAQFQKKDTTNNFGTQILAISASLLLIAVAMKQFAKMDSGDISKATGVITEMMVLFAALMVVNGVASKIAGANRNNNFGATILGMSVSLIAIAAAMAILSKLDKSGLEQATNAISQIMLVFSVLMTANGVMSKLSGGTGNWTTIAALAASIGVIAASLYALSGIDANGLSAATGALTQIMAMFAVVEVASALTTGAATSIAAMVLVIGMIGAAIALVANFTDVDEAVKIANSLSEVMLAVSAATLVIAASGMLGGAAAAVAGVTSMGIVLAGMIAVFALIGGLNELAPCLNEFIQNGLPLLRSLGEGLGNLIGGFVEGFLGDSGSGSGSSFGDDLVAFSENLSTFTENLSGISIDSGLLESIETITGIILKITAAEVLNGIASFITGGSDLADFGTSLVDFGEAMSNFADKVADLDSDAIDKASSAASILAELEDNLPRSGGLVQIIIGTKKWSTLSTGLSGFGTAMVNFSKSVSSDSFDADAVTAAATAGQTLAALQNNLPSSGNNFATFFEGNKEWKTISTGLKDFGDAMVNFSTVVSSDSFDANAVTAAATAGKLLAELEDSLPPTHNRFIKFFTGTQDWTSITNGLEGFGKAMVDFSGVVSNEDFDAAAITAAAKAGSALSELENSLPPEGLITKILNMCTEATSWDTISNGLEGFGTAMGKFSEAVTGETFDANSIIAAAEAGKALAELENALPESGGFFSVFTGSLSWDTISEGLEEFGEALAGFCSKVSGAEISSEKVATAVEAGQKLGDLEVLATNIVNFNFDAFGQDIAALGGYLVDFYGKISSITPGDISDVATSLEPLAELASSTLSSFNKDKFNNFGKALKDNIGPGLSALATGIANLDTDKLSSVCTQLETLVALANDASGLDMTGLLSLIVGVSSIGEDVSGALTSAVGDALGESDLSTSGSNAANSFLTAFVDALSSGQGTIRTEGASLVQSLADGATSKKSVALATFRTILNTISSSLGSYSSNFYSLGANQVQSLANGASSKKSVVLATFRTVLNMVTSSLSSYSNSFYSLGVNLVQGLANGISANRSAAVNAAKNVAVAAYIAAKIALAVGSPSRKGYELGKYFDVGFGNGLVEYASYAENASEGVAQSALGTMENAISNISAIVEDGIDAEPTIRPVLDLSNVSKGARSINGILNTGRTLLINTDSVGTVAASMRRIQNDSSEYGELTSELRKLRKDMSGMPRGDTYSVNGVTYDDGSSISNAVKSLVRAVKMERRV